MKGKIPALAKRSLALALALALLLSLCPVLPLTAKAAHTGEWTYLVKGTEDYKWINGAFSAEDDDLIYEDGQPYDWKVTVKPSKSPPPSVDVKASIKDANGNQVAAYSGTASLSKNALVTLFTSADFAGLTADLAGNFTLICEVNYNGTTYARLEQTFSRTGASSEPEATTEGTVAPEETTVPETTVATEPETTEPTEQTFTFTDGWSHGAADSKQQLQGYFITTEEDLAYEGDKAFDWTFELAQSIANATFTAYAKILDENGEVLFELEKPVSSVRYEQGLVISAEDFPELTADMVGTFTLQCQIVFNNKDYGTMTQSFSRAASGSEEGGEEEEPALKEGWEYADGYDWIVAAFNSEDDDLVFEGEQPYDWNFTLQQARANVVVDITAVIKDADGNVVSTVTKSADAYKSAEPTEILNASEFAELAANYNGEYVLVCTVTYNGGNVGRLVKYFSRVGGVDAEGGETPDEPGSTVNSAHVKTNMNEIDSDNMTMSGYNWREGQVGPQNVGISTFSGFYFWDFGKGLSLNYTLSDAFLEGFDGNVVINVSYITAGPANVSLVYHSTSGTETIHPDSITVSAEQPYTIKTATFTLNDAVLTNACDLGCSFILLVNRDRFRLTSVEVTKPSNEPGTEYNVALNSSVADNIFYDETPYDLTLNATTNGAIELVDVTYTLTGGNLTEALTETKKVALNKEGVEILDAAWFTENANGFGDFTLEVTMANEEATLVTKTFNFSRKMTSILASELKSATAENKDGVLVFGEDDELDLKLFLKNKLSVPFTGNVTVSFYKNGAPDRDQTTMVFDLMDDAKDVGVIVPAYNEYGIYQLVVTVTDENGNEVHNNTFTFVRQKTVFVNATLSSATNSDLVFVDDAPFDMAFNLQKIDGYAEKLNISWGIFKGEELLKDGKFSKDVATTETPVGGLDWTIAAGYGDFTMKLKITNSMGYVQEIDLPFSRIESIKVELTSESNPDLIFAESEALDLALSIVKQAGEDRNIAIDYTVMNGDHIVDSQVVSHISVSDTPYVLNLASANWTGTGTFTITAKLMAMETGEIFKTVTLQAHRVPSMTAELVYPGAQIIDGVVTYLDMVPYDIGLSLQKQVGNEEDLTVSYVATDAEGNEIVVDSITGKVGSAAAKTAPIDLSMLTGYGAFHLDVVVTDAAGIEVAATELDFARVEYITSKLVSASNSDLVFTEGEAFDLGLGIYNTNPAGAEAMQVVYEITGDGLEEPITFSTRLNASKIETYVNDHTSLANLPATGTFTLTLKIGVNSVLRHQATYTFSRVALKDTINSDIKSATSDSLVFAPGGDIDMMLYIEKVDEVMEGFAAKLTITDSEGAAVLPAVEANIRPFITTKFKVAELFDLSQLTNPGVYTITLTLTDNFNQVRHTNTFTFTLVSLEGSVELLIGSATNPDLVYTEGEAFDIGLQMTKTDGVAEAFKAFITITDKDGNVLKKREANVPARETMTVSIQDLIDLTDLPATGSFILNIVMIDAASNERANVTATFSRVKLASVKTQVSSNTNKDMIFTDKDAVDLRLYVLKTDGIEEELWIQYTVLDPDGNELAFAEGKTKVPAGEVPFKLDIELEPEQTAPYGRYNVLLTVLDNNGNIRVETETGFIRISGSAGEIKHQVSGSSSGTKMQFTPGMTLDLCLFIQKLDGVPESMPGELYVTAPSGAVILTMKGNLNVKAQGYSKYALDLNGKCNEFGIYTVTYIIRDDAGNVRASNTAKFKMISPTGDVAVAVQSASSKFPGLIYGKDDAFDLVLYVQKADGVEQTLQLRYTIYDMNGLVLETKEGKINAPALGYRKLPIELPDIEAFNKYGIFTIKVEIAGPTGQMIYNESFSFSRVLTPEKQLSVMGVCTHLSKRGMTTKQSQQYVDLARQAGISFWRDELPWSTVEPAKGQYRIPDSADAAVDYTLSIGLEPLFILDYGNDNYGSDVTTDEWLQGYLGYVEYMVTHFKGRIKYYEVWNEWNIGLGGMDKKYRDMADVYAKILIETYKVIKAIDPTITVIGGVVAGGEEKWTENFLKCPGAIDAMDVFSYHEYPDNDVKEFIDQAETVRALLTKYGRPDIPMWVTETGFPTHIGRNSFSEETSAGNLVSLYTWAIANPDVLDHIFWYDLHNDGVERENGEHNFGLLRNWNSEAENVPMAAKPSYVALCAMNSILADAEFVGMYDLGHKKISAYHFKKDGKDLLVAWADDQALNMVANVGENNIIVTDMYGNASALTPVDGKVSLFFSDAPIYIEYDLTNKLEMVEGGFELDKDQYSVTPAVTFPVKITRNNGLETQSGSYAFSMPDTWSVEGIEFGAAEAGATEIVDTVYVTVGDDASKGEMTITARVVIGGNVVGQFNVPIEMGDICTVNPDVVFTENGPEFKVSVKVLNEQSNKPLTGTINLLAPEALLGEASSIPFEIPAGENKAVLIDVPAEYANTFHTVKVEVVLGSGAKHTVTKPMSFLYAIEAPENMNLDGVIDDQWAGAMEFTIGEDDWVNTTDSDAEWPGNTAKGYAMWDDQYLYVAVEAHDASHYQTGTGTSIWMGDSIQLTTDISRFTVPAYYGYNEIGFSLNSENGAIENWNWFASPGKNVSQGGIFKIVRDDEKGITTYEVALPWSELLPKDVEFDFRSIGFALIVNENSIDEDGEVTGRTGWIEYMSGIGLRKEPEKFGDLILVNRSEIQ